MKQEINFRKTTGYRADDSVDAYVQTGLSTNYPTVTAQGNTVGWEVMGGVPFQNDLSLDLDARLAGVCGHQDTTEGIYRIDLSASGNYRLRCAAGADGSRVAYIRVFDGASLLSTLVSPQLTTGSFRYVDAADVERSGDDWPAQNQPKELSFASTTLRVYNGGQDVAGSSYAYIAHFSVESVAPPGVILDATKGVVTVSGAAGILLSPVAYDAIKGVIDIQSKPATSILQASSATKDIVYVVGKQADLLTGELYDTATSGAVSVSGTTGTLLSSGVYDAIKGVISIQSKPAISILHSSRATQAIVYVVGNSATLVDGVAEVFNATTAQITITEKTAEAVAVMMQALPDNVIIQGNNAELVQYDILDAISGSVVINGMSAFALSNIINATGGSVTISSSQAWATDPPFIEQIFYAVQEQRDQNMIRITHKRGDTFRQSFIAQGDDGLPVDITNYTIESQVRNKSGTLLSMLAVAKTDPANGEFDLTEEDTSGWPIYRPGSPTYSLYMDIQYTYPSGTIESTETLMISVKEDVTL